MSLLVLNQVCFGTSPVLGTIKVISKMQMKIDEIQLFSDLTHYFFKFVGLIGTLDTFGLYTGQWAVVCPDLF